MKLLPRGLLLLLLMAVAPTVLAGAAPFSGAGALRAAGWDRLLVHSRSLSSPSERIAVLSEAFLGKPYVAGTLVGSDEIPERLVIDLEGVDCFTLLDYVEALRRSASVEELPVRLTEVRYRDGRITYATRRHFFSDWRELQGIRDVTAEVGGERVRQVQKVLNLRQDGRPWLAGIAQRRRAVRYIPADALDAESLNRLNSGDYLGIYSEADGLDVSHTGIVVRRQGGVFLRHASSRRGEVVDELLRDYLRGKPGLVVLRAHPR